MPLEQTFENLIGESGEFRSSWQALEVQLRAWDQSRYFVTRYIHIDHGLRHWKFVSTKAEEIWRFICKTRNEWWSARSAFLLTASAYLHDVAMLVGYQHFMVLPEDCRKLIPRFLDKYTADAQNAQDPLAYFLVRKNQGLLACAVIQDLAIAPGPLAGLSRKVIEELQFLVQFYENPGSEKARMRAKELDATEPSLLLGAAAVLQVSDWSHLDRERLDTDELLVAVQESDRIIQQLISNPDVPELPADAGINGMLQTFFRSHYVFKHSMRVSDPPDNSISFSTRVGLPTNLSPSARSTLLGEWRAKMLPSRLQNEIAYDFLKEFCGITLNYIEPRAEQLLKSDNLLNNLPIPRVVNDYWIAQRWFVLAEDWRALIREDKLMASPYDELRSHINEESAYSQCDGSLALRQCPLPRLSRRLFLLIHVRITRGNPTLAELFFRALHHYICCPKCHGKIEKPTYGTALQEALEYTRTKFCEGLAKQLGIKPDDKMSPMLLREMINALQDVDAVRVSTIIRSPRLAAAYKETIKSLIDQSISVGVFIVKSGNAIAFNHDSEFADQYRLYGERFAESSQVFPFSKQ